jgi:polyphosphate kinase
VDSFSRDTADSDRGDVGLATAQTLASPAATHLYLNRELGQLAFNRRVLALAADAAYPLLERLKFFGIVSSNLDEFFEVRVAGLKAAVAAGSPPTGPDGLPAEQVYESVARAAHALVAAQYDMLNAELLPALENAGIRIVRRQNYTPGQAAWVRDYFVREVMPVLTPIGLDPAHPFPRVLNKSLNFAVELTGNDAFGRRSGIAIVQAPRVLPRLIRLPRELAQARHEFVFLSSVLHAHVDALFAGMQVRGCHQFRVTRNSELFVDEEEVKDLRSALRGELPHRHFGDAVRLEVVDNCSERVTAMLLQQFGLREQDLYRVDGPVNLVRLLHIVDEVDRPELKFPSYVAGVPVRLATGRDIFQAMRDGDLLLHHPYQSFDPVLALIEQAARDPQVLAIRQTVYRTGPESALMERLIQAARSGKEVTVVVELLARFDEEANINWAQRLEEVGAHVVYGVVGYKTHAKMLMVVRREDGRLRRYVHLSTGNYNAHTSRLYTDLGLLTCNEAIGEDVNDVFAQLTGLGQAGRLRHLWQSPFSLHKQIMTAIRREAAHARAGRPARIVAKMNALLEPEVIRALYEASEAGVTIDLVVRGVCALRPGLPGVSDNIRVRSVIGRFLEHTRIFCFENGGARDVFLASADWMGRNFFGRVEVCFPVLDPLLKQRVIDEGLQPYLDDNTDAWDMDADGVYRRATPGAAPPVSAQQRLLARLARPAAGQLPFAACVAAPASSMPGTRSS